MPPTPVETLARLLPAARSRLDSLRTARRQRQAAEARVSHLPLVEEGRRLRDRIAAHEPRGQGNTGMILITASDRRQLERDRVRLGALTTELRTRDRAVERRDLDAAAEADPAALLLMLEDPDLRVAAVVEPQGALAGEGATRLIVHAIAERWPAETLEAVLSDSELMATRWPSGSTLLHDLVRDLGRGEAWMAVARHPEHWEMDVDGSRLLDHALRRSAQVALQLLDTPEMHDRTLDGEPVLVALARNHSEVAVALSGRPELLARPLPGGEALGVRLHAEMLIQAFGATRGGRPADSAVRRLAMLGSLVPALELPAGTPRRPAAGTMQERLQTAVVLAGEQRVSERPPRESELLTRLVRVLRQAEQGVPVSEWEGEAAHVVHAVRRAGGEEVFRRLYGQVAGMAPEGVRQALGGRTAR